MSTTTKPEKAATAADAIRALARKHGSITAEIVLKDATRKTSPLHPFFDWNDTEAARKYRLIQAASLIRKINVQYLVGDERTIRVRAFHNVSDDSDEESGGYYVPLETALTVESYREQLMANCRRDMAAFQQKYAALSEVSAVIDAMKSLPAA